MEKELIEEEKNKPQWHYEVVKEFKKEVPVYDEEGKQIGVEEIITGRVVKKVLDDEVLKRQERINELKGLLRETDYQAIKYLEGQLTKTEYAETKALRQSYRDEINQLEEEIIAVKVNGIQ